MRKHDVLAGKVGAWVVKCDADNVFVLNDPASGLWDVRANQPRDGVSAWRLFGNYRAAIIQPGDRCFFWVSSDVPNSWRSGLWAECDVLAPATADHGGGPWIDRQKMAEVVPYLPLAWRFLSRPVPKAVVRAHPDLQDSELVAMPEMSNPVALTVKETQVIDQLIATNPSPVQSTTARGGQPTKPTPW